MALDASNVSAYEAIGGGDPSGNSMIPALVSGYGNLDLLVYGANPGGLFAAIAAARRGAKVLVLQPDAWIGGMLTGGLSATDIAISESSCLVVGMANDYFRDVADDPEVAQRQEVFLRNGYAAQPHVFARVLRRWMAQAGVTVITNAQLSGVIKSGTRITGIATTAGNFSARTYIDGTYEGDLIAAAGCSVAIGREANATYSESYNGVRPIIATANFDNAVSPYVVAGDSGSGLLPTISSEALGSTGDASSSVMAYTYRLCVAKSGTFKIAMPQPEVYNAQNYELLGRHFAAISTAGWTTLDGAERSDNKGLVVALQGATKYDWNSGSYPIGTNYISPECTEYITASYSRRAQIAHNVKQHVLGWFKFMREDSRVPAAVRSDAALWGLCADEFEGYGGFSPQLYVREGRRLVGDFILKETDLVSAKTYTDGVAVAYYSMDSHHVRRIITGGQVKNEGYLLQPIYGNGNPVPYRVMFPKATECTNLMSVFAISSTHTAFCSMRMEPVSMALGEAAGLAAYIAAQRGVDVSAVSATEVQNLQDRFRFAVPGGAILAQDGAAPFNGGTVTTNGTWTASPQAFIYGHASHAVASAAGAYKRFAPNLGATGAYDVYALYVIKTSSARSSAAPVSIVHAGGTTSLTLNQNSTISPAANSGEGGNWVNLGRFTFRAGTPSANYVEFQTDGTNGTVIELVKFVPAK